MNEPKTSNLGLNKIDRSSPSTTYFDLDKYLDQNWEKIDEGVGKVVEKAEETAAQVSSIQERLDIEKRRSVTLEPGLQVVHAERASAFKLEGLKGRTLVNLLGRDGGCESITGWTKSTSATIELSTANVNSGSNNFKVTQSEAAGQSYVRTPASATANVNPANYYIVLAWIKNETSQSFSARLVTADGTSAIIGAKSGTILAGATGLVWHAYRPTEMGSNTKADMDVYTAGSVAVGGVYYVDSFRIYEISAAEYAELDSMTPEQVAAKFPYIDSVQPVRNLYVIRYGNNLLPPFYEWALPTGAIINAPYNFTYHYASGTVAYNTVDLMTIPGQRYTLSVNNSVANARNVMNFYDANGTKIDGTTVSGTTTPVSAGVNTVTFQAPVRAETMRMYLYGNPSESGTASFSNPMLVIGNVAKPFKTREDAMLALQTDLFADPVTGTNADEVFEKDGTYFKLAKWKRVVLDENKAWLLQSSVAGYKILAIKSFPPTTNWNGFLLTKFNGNVLSSKESLTEGDKAHFNTASGYTDFYISIINTDSGWGDSYTPTADEIKAYFMGWTMFNGSAGNGVGNSPDAPANNVYNSIGTKWWARRSDGVTRTWADATITLPTTQAPNWTPYQLVYQLAMPTVEPVTSEGQLTLIEGDNQVEVGTGIVLREGVKPAQGSNGDWGINIVSSSVNAPLKNKVAQMMRIYRNSLADNDWSIVTRTDGSAYGNQRASTSNATYGLSASYSVTYLMLDSSPTVPFIGSVADNEKALLTDLTEVVQQSAARVSVTETSLNDAIRELLQQKNKRNVWGPIE
ncbi:hypothetical protein MKY66_06390 [Paenibacillus sp. FSL R5-0766]|uniref:hypothetical protein n=1 Tax=unclassified Paenibacillus TaxID=185978 RepID=UPI00096FFF09|nr:hypothetical protein [Paenibacillus sp. FSL R5-0765]OMF66310.1 hypothetical protein BK141_05125 [Paenibacillus sp. FSL R5-0765]